MTGIDAIEQIADPAERAKEIGKRLEDIPTFQARLRQMRQAAILEMRAKGLSYGAIAGEIGLHRNRIQQIAEGRTSGGQGGNSKSDDSAPATPKKAPGRPKKDA